MTIVEDDFLNKSKHNKLKDDPVKRRKFTSEATATPLHHNKRQVHEWDADNCLIDDDHHDNMPQLPTINLQTTSVSKTFDIHVLLTANTGFSSAGYS